MDMNRRQFFRVSGAGLAASSLVALGFSPTAALAETRAFKLTHATVSHSICPSCHHRALLDVESSPASSI